MNRSIALSLFLALAALPACWSHSTAPSQPAPERRSASDPPRKPRDIRSEDELPVVILPNDAAIRDRLCELLGTEGIGCTMTCVTNCNVHVPFSQRIRARELVLNDPWLAARVDVIEEDEYQAMIAPPEPLAAETQVSRADVDRQLAGPVRLYRRGDTAATCDPICVASNPSGIRVVHVARGSVFDRIGLRDGDLITAVDNQAIAVSNAVLAAQVARTKNRFRIDLDREGKAMSTQVVVIP